MKIEARLKALEKVATNEKRIKFMELISPEFVYTGRAMETEEEVFEKLNVVCLPPYLNNDQLEILYEKGLLKYSIKQTIEAMKENL